MLSKLHYSVLSIVFFSTLTLYGMGEITDIIEPLSLEAGKSDTFMVSDLFYAKEYNVKFHDHPDIFIEYFEKSNLLVLTASIDFEGYTVLDFIHNNIVYQIPVLGVIKPKHRFRFKPKTKPQWRMNVIGTFNSWNRNALSMTDNNSDGEYEVDVSLDPGQYLYQFVQDDTEFYDPGNPLKVDNGFGGFNSVFIVNPKYQDNVFLHVVSFKHESGVLKLKFSYERNGNPAKIKQNNILALLDNWILPNESILTQHNIIQIELLTKDLIGEKRLRIAVTKKGRASNMQSVRLFDGVPINGGQFQSWNDAIIYSIMIDRFADGDTSNSAPIEHDSLLTKANYMGGDLAGIIQKIEDGYFTNLGVNTLWISPINQNTNKAYREWPTPHRYFTGYHGYWPTHHKKVEERFGDLELFKKLVQSAHAHGFRVLLDFIANHTHEDHPYFKNHRDWFGTYDLPGGRKNIRLWDEYRLTTWFEPFLPSFDFVNSQAAVDTVTDNAIWWLTETNIDGFRLDAVKHIPNNLLRTLTKKIREQVEIPQGSRLFQIGETFGGYDLLKSYINNGQLSSQFNFNLYDVALSVFLNPDGSFETLAKEIEKSISYYGIQNLMGNVMSSHDKIRYMAYADNDIVLNSSDAAEIGWNNPPTVDNPGSYKNAILYYAYMFGIPGIPVVYYGDEIGMTGAADPDNRRMMRFGEGLNSNEAQMLDDVSKLIHLRKRHSSLRYGDFQILSADENTFVFLRSDMHERVLVAINKSEKTQNISVQLPKVYRAQIAKNLVSKDVIEIKGERLNFSLSASSFKYLHISNQGS